MLSMLQQMLSEDREESVRVAVVRSAALIAAMSPDCDKYAQVMLVILEISSHNIKTITVYVFYCIFVIIILYFPF